MGGMVHRRLIPAMGSEEEEAEVAFAASNLEDVFAFRASAGICQDGRSSVVCEELGNLSDL